MPNSAKSGWLWSGDGSGDIHVIGELAQLATTCVAPEQKETPPTILRASFVQPELLTFFCQGQCTCLSLSVFAIGKEKFPR